MQHLQLSDDDVEQLLAGDRLQGRPTYSDVALLMRRLRAEGVRERVPPMSPRLLAALDKSEAEADELAAARHQVREARRRWRVVGAAAMVAAVVGIVAVTSGVFSPDRPTHSTGAGSSGADDRAGGGATTEQQDEPAGGDGEDVVTAETTAPPPTEPPATDPQPPVTEAESRGDRDRDRDGDWDHGDGGRDGQPGWDWDDDGWGRDWDDWHWDWRDDGLEVDRDGPGGDPPYRFEREWFEDCGQDFECLWAKWREANPGEPAPGP